MPPQTPHYNLTNIRALLTEGFNDQELRRMCYDLPDFRPVYDGLAQNSSKAEIIDQLISYTERKLQFEALLNLIKKYNPTRYEKHQPYTEITTTPSTWNDPLEKIQRTLKPPCPYPGMIPFSAKEAGFFFGRDNEIWKIHQYLRYQRYLFIIGPSGSGKSSLIFAGLLPALQESSYFPQNFWLVREMRPSDQPWQSLSQAIEGDPTQPVLALSNLLARHSPARRLLLVIDQFEELFTQHERPEQDRFIAALQTLRSEKSCALLIAMRADFYPDLMNSDLWPVDLRQRVEIAPLRREALRQAIQRPAMEVSVHLETDLVERLLGDAANEPGVLSLVQETLVLLWDQMHDRSLSLEAYERLGSEGRSGLAVAIALKGDATLDELLPAQQAIARRIFLRLVQFGEGRADTRRQQPVTALLSTTDDLDLFDQTLRHLTNNCLLTLSGEESGDRRVDIAHEVLIGGWPTFQRWLSERREAERTRRRLETRAMEWVRRGRGRSGLLDEVESLEANRWLESPDAAELGYSENLLALVETSRATIEETEREKEFTRLTLERKVRALSVLNDVGQTLTSSNRLRETNILELICKQTLKLTGAQNMYIALYDEPTKTIRFVWVIEGNQQISIPPRQIDKNRRGKTEEVIFTRESILHSTEQEAKNWYRLPGRQKFRDRITPSWLGVPMIVGEKVLGMIAVYDWEREYAYDEQDLSILITMVSQIAIAVENARLIASEQEERLELIQQISKKMAEAGQSPDEVLEMMTRAANDAGRSHVLGATAYFDPASTQSLNPKKTGRIGKNQTNIATAQVANILVVAKPDQWQTFVMQALRKAGYNVYQAHDQASALRAIAGDQPDLIIVDATLADLLKTLAWQYVDNRLMVVTATPSVAEAVSAYRYGALEYLSKAHDIASLLEAVTAALQKQPVQQRLLV